MLRFPASFHQAVYFAALALLVIALPTSIYMLSVAQIILAVNWLWEGDFKRKWQVIKQRPAIPILSLFYLVHLLWMANSSDWVTGILDLKIKLPLLVLPLIIGTSHEIDEKRLAVLLKWYLATVLVVSVYSSYLIWTLDPVLRSHNPMLVSPFVWHIRWSLMVVVAIFSTVWLIKKEFSWLQWIFVPTILWLIFYLFLFQVLTGIVILTVIALILLIREVFLNKNLLLRWFTVVSLLCLIMLTGSYITHAYARFFTFEKVNLTTLESKTPQGHLYYHEPNQKVVENGHYVYLYICEEELIKEWNKRSSMSLNASAKNGEDLKRGLIRYLTSIGQRKDSAGLAHLSSKDIQLIESGATNCIDSLKYDLYPRLYRVFWELYNYHNGVNPSSYSVAQRFEYLKTAIHIIQKNIWVGVGTGDSHISFHQQYDIDNSILSQKWRLRAHNQLITFIITFGVIGFVIILFALLVSPFFEKKYSDFLFLSIFLVSFLSFLNEDTLETHQGISLVAIFYSLFLFYRKKSTESLPEKTPD